MHPMYTYTVGVSKNNSFSMNIMEDFFEIRSSIEILTNNMKIYTNYHLSQIHVFFIYTETKVKGN